MNLSKYSQQQKFFVLGLFGFGGALLLLAGVQRVDEFSVLQRSFLRLQQNSLNNCRDCGLRRAGNALAWRDSARGSIWSYSTA